MNFILLGAPRSGKHLMRRYIRSHPKLNCLTESDDVRFDIVIKMESYYG